MKKSLKITLVVAFAGLLVLSAINSSKIKDAAEQAGFDNVEEYKKAQIKNIETKAEYDAFVQRQAEIEAKAATNGGFLSVDEYKKAKAVDMPTKELYDQYLVQQAESKLAEDQRRVEESKKITAEKAAEEKQVVKSAASETGQEKEEDPQKTPNSYKPKKSEKPTTPTLPQLIENYGFLANTINSSTIRDEVVSKAFFEESRKLRRRLETQTSTINISQRITYNDKNVKFALSCEANRPNYTARYFYIFMKDVFVMPQHDVFDPANYEHGIVYKELDTDINSDNALRFYFRDIFNMQSAWGINYRLVTESANEYELVLPDTFPLGNRANVERKVTIDRKSGEAKVGARSYPCTKLSSEESELVIQFYTGLALLDAVAEWEKTEMNFSEKRDKQKKF